MACPSVNQHGNVLVINSTLEKHESRTRVSTPDPQTRLGNETTSQQRLQPLTRSLMHLPLWGNPSSCGPFRHIQSTHPCLWAAYGPPTASVSPFWRIVGLGLKHLVHMFVFLALSCALATRLLSLPTLADFTSPPGSFLSIASSPNLSAIRMRSCRLSGN